MKPILVGIDDFKSAIEGNYRYVDKTLIIEELLKPSEPVVAITRPRRFGKTLNMSMMSYFFDINKGKENRCLFKGLNIEKSKYFKEQGQHPVINLSFKNITSETWESCYERIKNIVSKEYEKHSYLLNSSKIDAKSKKVYEKIINEEGSLSDYEVCIEDLSRYLYKHFNKKVVILIDEYDTLITAGELNDYFKKASIFMGAMLSNAFKGNVNLYKGVLTGITRLHGAGIFSGLNNVDMCTIFDAKFKDKFGFTEKEVSSLLKEYNMEKQESGVREKYNGYNFGGEVIYNPYSVVKYISRGTFENFWLGSSGNELAKKKVKALIGIRVKDDIKKITDHLIQGNIMKVKISESIVINKEMNEEEILNLLLAVGYLKYSNYREIGSSRYADLSIPNEEVKAMYMQTLEDWLQEAYSVDQYRSVKNLVEILDSGSSEELKRQFEKILDTMSSFDLGRGTESEKEKIYQALVVIPLSMLDGTYFVESNKEAGDGRADIVLTPLEEIRHQIDKGIVIELKRGELEDLENLSKRAIEQIKEKRYYITLEKRKVRKIRLIGMAFHKRKAAVSIEEIELT